MAHAHAVTPSAGKVVARFDRVRSLAIRQEEDTVGDGRPHVWTLFRDGRPARQEVDTDRDGRADAVFDLDASAG